MDYYYSNYSRFTARVALTDSENYRSIAVNNILSKILDHIIIDHQVHS